MNRLGRYIIRRWLLSFIPALLMLVTAYLAGDTAFTMWELLKQGLSPPVIAAHFALKVPTMAYQITPIAALLATLLTLTGMKRSGEMTAAFASGVSGTGFSLPILACALTVSLASYYLNETLAPGANRVSRDLVRSRSGPGSSVVGTERIWLLEGSRVIHIRSVQEGGKVLLEPTILQFEGKGLRKLDLRMDAPVVRWENGQWVAEKTFLRRFEEGFLTQTEVLSDTRLPMRIRPEEFYRVRRKPEEMSRVELVRYVENLRLAGLPFSWHQVRIYRKASAAALSLIFTVIALPVGFGVPIRGGVPLGIGLSLLLTIIFWSGFSFSLSLGYSGLIPAPAAAWAAQAVALVLGLAALWLVKRPRLT
ncbi:MAG: LptF/LptG family permease [bacterium]|nr:MAG: LptF/LptG family permease [bacterium]